MSVVGKVIGFLARVFDSVGIRLQNLANLCYGILPAVLPPEKIMLLTRDFYRKAYGEQDGPLPADDLFLEPWEAEVLDRYKVRSGALLVLGSGIGREPVMIARRGMTSVGVDTNERAVRLASRTAAALGVPARFLQASFLNLPFVGSSFDYILLPSFMYSSVSGAANRQTWLRDLGRLLKPDGLVILSFSKQRNAHDTRTRFLTSLNRLLNWLPGSNPFYQIGDDCVGGHFLHGFRSDAEIREELLGAGASIRELQWERGFAVAAITSKTP